MSFKSHNVLYNYGSRTTLCHYCRRPLSSITRYKRDSWDGHTVCKACYLQLSHGVKLEVQGFFKRVFSENPKLCKWCKKNMIQKMYNGLYPHFCGECQIKFNQMVKDNPKCDGGEIK